MGKSRQEKLKDTQAYIDGLKNACKHLGINGAVIGISGGKDSTIVAKLMVEVLGKDNVLGVLMPNGVQKDIDVSQAVVDFLNIKSITVNIGNSYDSLLETIDSQMFSVLNKGMSRDSIVNISPRIRMTVLYGIAQSMGKGWRVIGTTNRSEEYIGWLTKWGDGGVDFEPIIDLSVTELREFGLYLGLPEKFVHKVPIDGLTELTDEERFGFTYEQLDAYMDFGTSGDSKIDAIIKQMHDYSNHKRNPVPIFKLE